jgi:hypothetical protein
MGSAPSASRRPNAAALSTDWWRRGQEQRTGGGRELGGGGREKSGNRGRRKGAAGGGLVWFGSRGVAGPTPAPQRPGPWTAALWGGGRARHRLWARCSQVMARSAGGGQPPSTGAATEAVSVSKRQRRAWRCWALGWPGRQVRVLPAASARRWLPTGRPDVVGIPAASSSNGHAATHGARRVSPSPLRRVSSSRLPAAHGMLAQSVGPQSCLLRGVGSR